MPSKITTSSARKSDTRAAGAAKQGQSARVLAAAGSNAACPPAASPGTTHITPARLSDKQLYALCKQYGTISLQARWKFAGLLPEVERRRLYKRNGCSSIYMFAQKMCGMTTEVVEQVLRLDRRLEDLPELRKLFVNGVVSFHILRDVAVIASPANDKQLAKQLRTLSRAAIRRLVQDEKRRMSIEETAEISQENTKIPISAPGSAAVSQVPVPGEYASASLSQENSLKLTKKTPFF